MTGDPAVIAFLNELGQAMRDQQAVEQVRHARREQARRDMQGDGDIRAMDDYQEAS